LNARRKRNRRPDTPVHTGCKQSVASLEIVMETEFAVGIMVIVFFAVSAIAL